MASDGVRYTVVAFLCALCAALLVLGMVLPWAVITKSVTVGSTTVTVSLKLFLFDFCTYSGDDVKVECKTYEEQYSSEKLEWCSTQKHQAEGARACAILGVVFLVVSIVFSVEKICACVERFRGGLWVHLHRVGMIFSMITSFAAFILVLLWYTQKPDGCTGNAYSDQDGSKIAGAAFLFMTCGIMLIVTLVVEAKLAGGGGAGQQDGHHAPVGEQYIPPDQPRASGLDMPAAPPPQQEIGAASGKQMYNI